MMEDTSDFDVSKFDVPTKIKHHTSDAGVLSLCGNTAGGSQCHEGPGGFSA